jgi:cell division protein FtsW
MGMGTPLDSPLPPVLNEKQRTRHLLGVDVPLLLTMVALLVFGLLMLFSASWDFSIVWLEKPPLYVFSRQLIWVGIGLSAAAVLTFLDYHLWRKLAVPTMLITIAALVGVLFVNEIRLGAARSLLNGSVQPSELAKLMTIIYLAVWLYSKREHLHDIQLGLLPLSIILGIIGGLIYLQPDLSATATVLVLGGMLFFLAGGDIRQILFLLIAAVIAAWLVVQTSQTGQNRIHEYLAGIKDPTQSSYHVLRSLEAIINGGLFGMGIGQGATKLTGLPVPPTDSIFAVIVEELGLFGAVVLIGLYGLLVWRGMTIAWRAPDLLGALLASGIVFWIGIEAVVNMAVLVGLLPFAGNALPFISAGGSNMVASLAAIGILLNISRQRGEMGFEEEFQERRTYSAVVDLRGRNRRRRISRPGRG